MTQTPAADLAELYNAPTKAVKTSALKTGDLIRLNGCLMEIGQIHRSGVHTGRPVYWTKAKVLAQFNSTIPASWMEQDEDGKPTWAVQGNDLATWHRIKATA